MGDRRYHRGLRLVHGSMKPLLDSAISMGDVVYFSAYDYSTDPVGELAFWSTDGSTNGTVPYTGYGESDSHPYAGNFAEMNGTLYFRYYTGTSYVLASMQNASGAIVGAPSSWSMLTLASCRPQLRHQQRHDKRHAERVEQLRPNTTSRRPMPMGRRRPPSD